MCCVLELGCGSARMVSGLQAEAQLVCSCGMWGVTLTLTPPSLQNETANVVVQQHSRKFLKMGILMPETC